jgi:hypothetical protein
MVGVDDQNDMLLKVEKECMEVAATISEDFYAFYINEKVMDETKANMLNTYSPRMVESSLSNEKMRSCLSVSHGIALL